MSGRPIRGVVLVAGAAVILTAGGAVAVERVTSAGDTSTASVRPSTPVAASEPGSGADPTPDTTVARPTASAVPRRVLTPHPVGPPKTTATTTPRTTATTSASAKKTTTVTGGMGALEQRVLVLTNAERAKHGCAALRGDPRLAAAARAHSNDMALHKYFDHNSQDGTTPWDRIKRAGYPEPGAENIAMGYPTAAAVMKGWMNSPGHRANILNCKLRALGVGVHSGGSGGPWWTQDFGWI
jgi:uncharacterized protein YkwD